MPDVDELEPLEAEFSWYSQWLVDAIESLGIADRIPAACRGSGNPAILVRLRSALAVGPGDLVLDLGCGLGGPGAWLARETGAAVVGIDVVEAEVRGCRRLFGPSPAVVATTTSLPFRDGCFDAAWALGTVELIADKDGACRELARVLRPGGVAALLVYGASRAVLDGPRAGRFEPPEAYVAALRGAGLAVDRARPLDDVPPAPPAWTASAAAVHEHAMRARAGDPRLPVVAEELAKVAHLCASTLRPWELVAHAPVTRASGKRAR